MTGLCSGMLLDLGNGVQFFEPGLRRATPDLQLRSQHVALAQAADAKAVKCRIVDGVRPIDRCAALSAEGLGELVAAVSLLHIDLRFSRQQLERAGRRSDHGAEGAARKGLAVGAMADQDLFRIDLGLEGDAATVTASIHLPRLAPVCQGRAVSSALMPAS